MTVRQPSRGELIAKYGIDRPPLDPQLDTTVQGVLDADRIVAQTWRHDGAALFDPKWSPAMYALAQRWMSDLRAARANGLVEYMAYDSHGHETPFDPDDPHEPGTLVNFVGEQRIYVCRLAPELFSTMLQNAAYLHRVGEEWSCDVGIVASCGGQTMLHPYNSGGCLLLFEICEACNEWAGQAAETNFIVSEAEA